MPVWGQYKFGHAKWGYGGIGTTAETRRRVLSNNHPWFRAEGLFNGYREAEWQVWTVDPTTLADVTRLPHVAGGTRESNWEDISRQQERLVLTFLDPDEYRPGGPYASLVLVGTLVRLYWVVRGVYGAVTQGTGLYRITAPAQGADAGQGAEEFSIQAEGWLEKPLQTLQLNGANPLGDAITLRDNMLPFGCPVIWGVDTYATLAAAIIFAASGHRLRVPEMWPTLHWWGTTGTTPTEPPPPPPEPPAPGTPATADVGAGPNTTNRGEMTHFDISWTVHDVDPTADDAIFIGPDGLSLTDATAEAGAVVAGGPTYLLGTGGMVAGRVGIDLALDFGVGIAARFWYWHRIQGVLDTSASVALLG